jgi:universal stress protein E
MEHQVTVLVVIDPNQTHHPAMDKALLIAGRADGTIPTKMVFLLAPGHIPSSNQTPTLVSSDWIREQLYVTLKDMPIDYSCVMGWGENQSDVVLTATRELSPTLTIMPYYDNGHQSRIFSDDKWKLLREANNPVIITSKSKAGEDHSRRILCAFKVQDEKYDDRNKRIGEVAQKFSAIFGLEPFAVNAYQDSMEFPDRAKIANLSSIKNENIHITLGEPDDVICKTAEEVNADLIVIASTQRKGWKGALRGNTIERIIRKLDRDVLMV